MVLLWLYIVQTGSTKEYFKRQAHTYINLALRLTKYLVTMPCDTPIKIDTNQTNHHSYSYPIEQNV